MNQAPPAGPDKGCSRVATSHLRLGLCCQFAEQPIKFRTTTVTAMLRLAKRERLARLSALCRSNAEALLAALRYCAGHGIGGFRVNSQILPVKTHVAAGYELRQLPDGSEIIDFFRDCGRFARANRLRLSGLHPYIDSGNLQRTF